MVLIAVAVGTFCWNYHPFASPEWYVQVHWYESWFHGESGFLEVATAVILLFAVIAGALCLRNAIPIQFRWIRRWLVLVLAATVYFAGEEISWGQHLIGWDTPAWYHQSTGNHQQETNLHNISGWFNQKPRWVFLVWVWLGGVVIPLRRHFTGRYPDPEKDWSYWFWPTWVCGLTAALSLIVKLPEWITKFFEIPASDPLFGGIHWPPPSETQELCLAIFLLLYFCSLHRRKLAYREIVAGSAAGITEPISRDPDRAEPDEADQYPGRHAQADQGPIHLSTLPRAGKH